MIGLGILGKKVGMTQIFQEDGRALSVTVIQAGPCIVVQKKTMDKEEYNAVQVGFEEKKEKQTTKPLLGHFKKRNVTPKRYLHEFVVSEEELGKLKEGSEIKVDIFQPGDRIDVTGISKGRGFAGVMKRHGFKGYPAGHGTHEYFRHGGSIGPGSSPGRVAKGIKMPGQMGNKQITTQSIEVVDVKPEQNLLLVKGSVPGANKGLVVVQKAVKYLNRKEKQVQETGKINPLKASKRGG